MNEHVKRWMTAATTEEQKLLAQLAKTSRGQLYQLASGERTAGPALARKIALASNVVRKKNPKLPKLKRSELCPACSECEFAKRCGG